ncbi:MAG: DUF3108 domain-containing protein [Proteobacteria bacterium]|nr:DUF3108 domain-containing protein [Pseudomonadota bacterium]
MKASLARGNKGSVYSRLILLLLLLSPVTQASGALKPFKVTYEVDYSIASGVMTLSLGQNGSGSYTLDSITEAKGAARLIIGKPINEHATFEIDGGSVKATGYKLDDGSKKNKKDIQINYNWSTSKAALQSEDGAETKPLDSNTMDQLVMQAAAILEVKSGNRQFSFKQIKPGRGVSSYIYKYLGEETLKTDIGELKTVKYSRTKEGASKTTHFWFAVDHNFTPVQLHRIKKNATVFTAKLISLEL